MRFLISFGIKKEEVVQKIFFGQPLLFLKLLGYLEKESVKF